jgi:hypothetical protein
LLAYTVLYINYSEIIIFKSSFLPGMVAHIYNSCYSVHGGRRVMSSRSPWAVSKAVSQKTKIRGA